MGNISLKIPMSILPIKILIWMAKTLMFVHPSPTTVNFPKSWYKARHAHKRLYTVLSKYSKIQVLPGVTSCRLMKYYKQAIELNSLLNK